MLNKGLTGKAILLYRISHIWTEKFNPWLPQGFLLTIPFTLLKKRIDFPLFITWYKRHKKCYNLTILLTAVPLHPLAFTSPAFNGYT